MVSSSEFHFVSQTHIDFLSSSSSNNKMERLSPPSSCNAKLINKRLKPRVSRGRRAQNQDESQPKRSSIYRGVTKHRWTGRYEAHLWDKHCWNPVQNKKGRQGAYDDEKAAAHTYDLAALKYWGTETILNFPVSTYANEYQEMQNLSKEEYLASLRRRSSGFSRGASKYRGVAKHHHNGRWEARIGRVYGNKYLYLGTFDTQEDAATAYDLAALEYRGPNAVTNFEISRYIKRQPQNQTPQHPQLFNHQPQSHTQQHPQLFNHLLVQQTEPQHELAPLPEINEQPIITQGFESQIVADPIVFENYNEPNWNMCPATCFNEYTNIEINRANDLYNFLRNDGFTDDVENIFDGCGAFGCDVSVNAATAGSASASAIDYGDGGILNNPETVDGVFGEVGEGVADGGVPEVNSGSYPFAISIYS